MNKRQNLTSTQGFLFFGQFKQQQIFVFLWPAWFQNLKKKKKRRRKEGKREREKREVIIWYGTDTGWSLYYFTDIKNNSCYCYLFSPYKQTLRQEWIFSECQKGPGSKFDCHPPRVPGFSNFHLYEWQHEHVPHVKSTGKQVPTACQTQGPFSASSLQARISLRWCPKLLKPNCLSFGLLCYQIWINY